MVKSKEKVVGSLAAIAVVVSLTAAAWPTQKPIY